MVRRAANAMSGRGIGAEGKGAAAADIRGGSITVSRDNRRGVFGQAEGAGDLDADIRVTGIATSGRAGYGVEGRFQGTGIGKFGIRIEGGSIATSGDSAPVCGR